MAKEFTGQDRNFDDLARRFKKNVYDGLKGAVRLAVLERDCRAHIPVVPFGLQAQSWRILDAGGGQGQFSLSLAQAGHHVVICDISAEMLKLAEDRVRELGLESQVTLLHCAVQDLAQHLADTRFDWVVCHALMEWLQEPEILLPLLCDYLLPGGFISLTFYNVNALIYKNLLRTNYKKIIKQDYAGFRGSLTPINPMAPAQVLTWVDALPLALLAHSGIRVFHDYIFNKVDREREPDTLVQLELQFSQQEPYRSLGRYMHLLMQKNL